MKVNEWTYDGRFSSEILSGWIGEPIAGFLLVYIKEDSLLGPYAAKFVAYPPYDKEVHLVAGEPRLDAALQLAKDKGFVHGRAIK